MKMITAELTGLALDWALAVALKKRARYCSIYKALVFDDCEDNVYLFAHTDPAMCIKLIKKYRANVDHTEHAPQIEVSIWHALTDDADPDFDCQWVVGDTVEQAVARCVVQMRLGDSVSVPDELVGVAA